MAETAVEFCGRYLIEKLKFHVYMISNMDKEIKKLKNELVLLKGLLPQATERLKMDDLRFRELEREMKEVVYDAENAIDSWLTHAAASRYKKYILAKELMSLREDNLIPIKEKVSRELTNPVNINVEQHSIGVDRDDLIRHLVGFEDQERIITDHLMEEGEEVDVVSITGMPGLGKTTLAWKIFQNPAIKLKFPTRIWICVSGIFNMRDVLLNILKELTRQDMSCMDVVDLVQTVCACLEKQGFLLVMDDIWTIEAWDAIKHFLPKRNRKGKVLITSRDENVGRYANFMREPHMLRFLNTEESWQLLQVKVFGNLSCPPQLEGQGKCIAKQCGGLPFAIVVIAAVLREMLSRNRAMKETVHAWDSVAENVSAYRNQDLNILNIVALSYNNLPDSLRDCFLYLGVFPKDYEIHVWTLTCLWIAEGFVQYKDGQSLEKTAKDNLKELISRNIVMVGATTPNGKLKTCRVHVAVREFCMSRATSAYHAGLFHEIKMSEELRVPYEVIKSRRICIHSHLPEFLDKLLHMKVKDCEARSFLSFYKEPVLVDPEHFSTVPKIWGRLRVLDSKSFKLSHFPDKVTRLIHLKYITLSCDNLNLLPEGLSDLWRLQTLLVNTKSRTLQMKANIWKMIQLRHLKTKAEIILGTSGEGEAGENLQTLSRLSPKCCNEDTFKRARNLRKLGIRGSLASDFNAKSLEKLNHLENLKLVNDVLNGSTSDNPMRSLPPLESFPRNIKRLTLSTTYLDWEHTSTLGKIATLKVLKLKNYAFKGESWNVDGRFCSLKFLLIDSTDLEFWEASDDQFPRLRCLVLKNCSKLHEIPLGLAKSLQILNIEPEITKSAIHSARKIEAKKKEMLQGSRIPRWGRFKLFFGPGCE